jgi:hypothetical protein
MARIGVIPTKETVQLREPDGDAGTIPAATESAAGVMTAQQVRMLRDVYGRMQGDSAAPVVIERAADTSHLVTRDEVQALVQAIPRSLDMTPTLAALRSEIESVRREATDNTQRLLSAPQSSPTEIVDPVARQVMDGVIAGLERLDARLREVERFVQTVNALAEIKGSEDAA